MRFQSLREECYEANITLSETGLVLLTWGNVSILDRQNGVMAIKPSGVPYGELSPKDIVIVDLANGSTVDGTLKPSSDTRTHLQIYGEESRIGAIVHTHSHYAVCFAQRELPVPIIGTTHADFFADSIPVTRLLTESEIEEDYETNTGIAIIETFTSMSMDMLRVPGVLVARHGPFAWGDTSTHAVENAIVLEEVARLVADSWNLGNGEEPSRAPAELIAKHNNRKHGPNAYYGQHT